MSFQCTRLKSKSLCEFILHFSFGLLDTAVSRERSLRLEIGPKDVGPDCSTADALEPLCSQIGPG
jgi:hypothetical protein